MKIKKIMLINPGVHFPRRSYAPPLGLLYLVSVLRRKFLGQFEIELIDQPLYNLSFKQVGERIKIFNPDLVGFSCLSVDHNEMVKLSRIVKELNPKCITVVGGPHASVFHDYILKNSKIDIVVIGEGETTFPELIQKIQKDKPIENVKGIALKKNNKIIFTPPREPIENLDSIPFPAWDLIDFKKYSNISPSFVNSARPWTVIFTSRGCPYQCAYCHNIFGKRARFRSPENVISEIELLIKNYNIKELLIADDIFNLDLARAKQICDLIIEKGIKIKISFPNGLRGDIMDRELIKKLKQAGCYLIAYAVETASPRLQRLVQKNLNLNKICQVINWSYQEKIIPQAFFMLGFPSESREEMEMSIRCALSLNILFATFNTVVIFPRTQLMKIAEATYPNFNFNNWQIAPFETRYSAENINTFYARVTGTNLSKLQRAAYRRFYLRPKIIFRILWYSPKNLSLLRGVFRGLSIAFIAFYKLQYFFSPHRKFLKYD